jgi:hypothetical protein
MLHIEAVEPGTFSLLKRLMALEALTPFSLVGETALALRYGHRSSVDLDLFFYEKFDHEPIINELTRIFGENFEHKQVHTRFGIFCFIEQVKVDLVYYPHQPVSPFIGIEDLRLYDDPDIGAMKIQAILGRAKKKDFWDLFELLKHYSLQQLMDWHLQKFPSQMLAISIPHAITYFTDAEESEDPVSFKGQTWNSVKKGIQKAVRDYLS